MRQSGATTTAHRTPVTLAERWNGSSWSVQPTANPGGINPELVDVSCTSARACTAVGSAGNGGDVSGIGALAERWNGTSWSIERDPNIDPDRFEGCRARPAGPAPQLGLRLTGIRS